MDQSAPSNDGCHFVASSVLHMAEMPLDANVQFITVMAPKMPLSEGWKPRSGENHVGDGSPLRYSGLP